MTKASTSPPTRKAERHWLRGALLVTADARLHRRADRLGFVVDPVDPEQLADE